MSNDQAKARSVKLADGREVLMDGPEWLDQVFTVERHLAALNRMRSREDRRQYLEQLGRSAGEGMKELVKWTFTVRWVPASQRRRSA